MEGKQELLYFILKRIAVSVLVILGTIFIVFLISHYLNPNPAALWAGPKARPSTIASVIRRYGLNQPIWVQLYYFVRDFFTGNFGTDPVTGLSISSEIFFYFPNTIELVLTSLVIIVLFGVGLGYIAAINFGTKKDALIRILYTAAWASPTFLVSILAVIIFSSYIPIFPSGGMYSPIYIPPPRITGLFILDSLINLNFGDFTDGIYHIILPAFTLAFLNFGIITRISRNGILGVKWLPYVKSAKARGLDQKQVNRHHILRNGLIESNTVIAVMFGWLITGDVIVEEIFSWPGIGKFAYSAIVGDDYPVLIFIVITFTILVIVANLIADIMYAVLDPRIRLGGEE
ncbi:MAG: ABC transporter permease [Thermoplasmatales archaeon]|nr:ABC transporter permease [Candidatus Thermoplasmatota archaeon]MDA8054386.1 ABC transporter permease [Thermoplasmatales archaeon]